MGQVDVGNLCVFAPGVDMGAWPEEGQWADYAAAVASNATVTPSSQPRLPPLLFLLLLFAHLL